MYPSEQIEGFTNRLAANIGQCEGVETQFNLAGGKKTFHPAKHILLSRPNVSDLRDKTVELMFASVKVGAVSLHGVPKEKVGPYTNIVLGCWNTSGISNSILNTSWTIDPTPPKEEGGLIIWPNEAHWSGETFEPSN